MKSNWSIILILNFILFSCNELVPRRPKQHGTFNFYKEVVAQNKKLNALETKKIKYLLEKDSINQYELSSNGFWYTYLHKDSISIMVPSIGDLVTVRFKITKMNDEVVYDFQNHTYAVDKEEFIPGLQEGVKLMKKGETITFVIPSYRAYGVTGDGNRIGINQTLKSTLTLIDIKKENNEIK